MKIIAGILVILRGGDGNLHALQRSFWNSEPSLGLCGLGGQNSSDE